MNLAPRFKMMGEEKDRFDSEEEVDVVEDEEEEKVTFADNPLISEEEEKEINISLSQKKEQSLEEKEAEKLGSGSDAKNILMMIGAIVALFVFSIAGFKVYNQLTGAEILTLDQLHQENLEGELSADEGFIYNGFSFIKADGLWWTEVNAEGRRIKIPLHFNPKEVEQIQIEGKLSPDFYSENQIFIAIDPEVQNKFYTLALSEISFNTAQGIKRIPVGACTEENYACENRTIINCETAQGRPVIELELNEEPAKIVFAGSCIKVSGQGYDYDIVKAANRLLYTWYGIMD